MPPIARAPFPQSPLSQLWLALCAWLKADPVLKAGVDTWQLWDGGQDAMMEPSESNMPLFRMTLQEGPGQWLDENASEYVLNCKIEIGVNSLILTDITDYWIAVHNAIFTGNALLNQLQQYQLIQKTITMPGIGIKLWGAKNGLAATGILRLKVRVNS